MGVDRPIWNRIAHLGPGHPRKFDFAQTMALRNESRLLEREVRACARALFSRRGLATNRAPAQIDDLKQRSAWLRRFTNHVQKTFEQFQRRHIEAAIRLARFPH